ENGISGEHGAYDSVADIISLLSRTGPRSADAASQRNRVSRNTNSDIGGAGEKEPVDKNLPTLDNRLGSDLDEKRVDKEYDDDDSNLSTSASESSHPGEYEESDEETSGEKNKLHYFTSPPKSAGIRRNISPGMAENEVKQFRKSSQKNLRSNIKRTETSSNRGARLEDDFVSHNSSDDDPAIAAELLQHQLRMQRSVGGTGSAGSQRFIGHSGHLNHNNNSQSSGYHSSNYVSSLTSSPKSRGHLATKSRSVNIAPKISSSPNQRPEFDPRLYSDNENLGSEVSPLSRMSKKSLREINNPFTEADVMTSSGNKTYDHTRYLAADVTDSFEAGMLATIAREAEAELEDVLPAPQPAASLQTGHSFHQTLNPSEMTHLYSESPATTSDDDTSFSTWKAPVSLGTLMRQDVTICVPTHVHTSHRHTYVQTSTHINTQTHETGILTRLGTQVCRRPASHNGAPSIVYIRLYIHFQALNQMAHNYQDEMKSRRSSDTLTSSNPRDWSGVISPPIGPMSGRQNLEGTMEGISDDLSDDAAALGQRSKGNKTSEEEEKLDLLFDPKLNCYYDPKTKKWYELVS
ncbi:unnamed protein product, partial [Candidula unifasciata]